MQSISLIFNLSGLQSSCTYRDMDLFQLKKEEGKELLSGQPIASDHYPMENSPDLFCVLHYTATLHCLCSQCSCLDSLMSSKISSICCPSFKFIFYIAATIVLLKTCFSILLWNVLNICLENTVCDLPQTVTHLKE